jgi:hypothetical protein
MALDATEYIRIRSPSETKACTFLSDPSSTLRTGAKIIWVWLLYDDAEVAENQQNTGIDGVRLPVKRPRYQNIPRSELSRAAK